MPDDQPATLRSLFDELKADSPRVSVADDASIGPAVKAHISGVEWVATAPVLLPKIAELLDIKLSTVFVAFWRKADEVARALEDSRHSPQPIEVSLLECSTEATLKPYIEVRFKGMVPGKQLPVTVSLFLKFNVVELVVRGGSFARVGAGECVINGSIKLDGVILAKLKKPWTITIGGWDLSNTDSDHR